MNTKRKFPQLQKPEPEMMESYLPQISTGKAVSWNMMSDIFLTKPYLEITKHKLTDLWSLNWNDPSMKEHLQARMIFLNKNFLNKPGPQDFRSIAILPNLSQVLESRFLYTLILKAPALSFANWIY